MEASTDLFISIIRENHIIYDKKSDDFKNSVKKDEAWEKVAKRSKMTVEAAKKRYVSLRAKFSRVKKQKRKQSGSAGKKTREWVFYDQMLFLQEFVSPRDTCTNDNYNEEMEITGNDEELNFDNRYFEEHGDEGNYVAADCDIEIIEPGSNNDELDFVPIRRSAFVRGNSQDFTPITSTPLANSSARTNQRSTPEGTDPRHVHLSQEELDRECCRILSQDYSYIAEEPNTNQDNLSTNFASAANKRSTTAMGNVSREKSTPLTDANSRTRVSAHSKSSKNEKAPNADSVRKKMDNYLTQCSQKLLERPQRSPHAPFLAYLGTKLDDVPKENLTSLEFELLDIVTQAGKREL